MRNPPHASIAARLIVGAVLIVGALVLATTDFGGSAGEQPPSHELSTSRASGSGAEIAVRADGDPRRDRRETSGDPGVAPETVCVRHGVARHFETGEPVPGALIRVRFEDGPERVVLADDAGRFTISFDRSGDCRLQGFADGLLCEPVPRLRVAEGAESRSIEVWFRAPAEVRGRVVDQNGAPVVGARVELAPKGVEGRPAWRTTRFDPSSVETSAATDADGRFLVESLLPGQWSLRASARGHASLAQLVSAPEASLELVLAESTPGLSVTVRDLDGDLVPVRAVWLEVGIRGSSDRWQAVEWPVEEAELRKGVFELAVRHFDPTRVIVLPEGFAAIRSEALEDPRGKSVELTATERGFEVRGRLVDPSGEPLADARIESLSGGPESRYSFTATGGDGHFVLRSTRQLVSIRATASGHRPARVELTDSPETSEDLGDWVLEPACRLIARGPTGLQAVEGLRARLVDWPHALVIGDRRLLAGQDSVEFTGLGPGEGAVQWELYRRGERTIEPLGDPVPFVLDPEKASLVEVSWPDSALTDLRVQVRIDDRPASFLSIEARHRVVDFVGQSVGPEDGLFVFGLPAGPVEIGLEPVPGAEFVPLAEVELQSGAPRRVDIELRTVHLFGRLIDSETGLPVRHGQVELLSRRGDGDVVLGRCRSDPSGVFDVGVQLVAAEDLPGVRLRAQTTIHQVTELADGLRFGVGEATDLGDLMLDRGCELSVIFTGDQEVLRSARVRFVSGRLRLSEPVRGSSVEFDALPAGSAELILIDSAGKELVRRPVRLSRGLPNFVRWTL